MIVHFIRHSITVYNEKGLVSGGLVDSPLCENGIKLIRELKEKGIYPKETGTLYCSSLCRTKQTLSLIYPDLKPIETERLDERRFGLIEFMTREEMKIYYQSHPLETDLWNHRDIIPEKGESINQLFERCNTGFLSIVKEAEERGDKEITIGGHGGYLKVLAETYGFMPFESEKGSYFVHNGRGVTLDVRKDEKGNTTVTTIGLIGGNSYDEIGMYY